VVAVELLEVRAGEGRHHRSPPSASLSPLLAMYLTPEVRERRGVSRWVATESFYNLVVVLRRPTEPLLELSAVHPAVLRKSHPADLLPADAAGNVAHGNHLWGPASTGWYSGWTGHPSFVVPRAQRSLTSSRSNPAV